MPFSIIPFLLLAIPLAEIAAFVVIGGQIGVWWTLLMVLVTAIGGSILLRIQGFGLLNRIRTEIDAGRVPSRELVHGVMILIAGILLLTPGFITDAMGFALFIPHLRDALWAFAKTRIRFETVVMDGRGRGSAYRDRDSSVIDLDEDEFNREPDDTSPWHDRKDGPRD